MGEKVNLTHPLERFTTYGWIPDESLTEDENLMDLTLLVTRSSTLRQGSMACLLVKPRRQFHESAPNNCLNEDSSVLVDRILSVATNQALYKATDSDIHAEIAAIGYAAQRGIATVDCTAYITMPPCKRCFAALHAAGIKRMVSRYALPENIQRAAHEHRIELEVVKETQAQRDRVAEFVRQYTICTDGQGCS